MKRLFTLSLAAAGFLVLGISIIGFEEKAAGVYVLDNNRLSQYAGAETCQGALGSKKDDCTSCFKNSDGDWWKYSNPGQARACVGGKPDDCDPEGGNINCGSGTMGYYKNDRCDGTPYESSYMSEYEVSTATGSPCE